MAESQTEVPPAIVHARSDAALQWCRSFLVSRGLDAALADEPGVTVVDVEARRGTGIASAYMTGSHVAIFTDPNLRPSLASFEADQNDISAFAKFAAAAGAEVLGSGVQRTLVGEAPTADTGDDMVRLHRESANDVARLNAFFDRCTGAEVEEAAIERDQLDPVIFCVEESSGGPILAYASAFPDEDFAGEWDIGVLVRPDARRQGLAVRCVAHLAAHLLADNETPLYRHDLDNAGSAKLSASVGFEPVSYVTAAQFSR